MEVPMQTLIVIPARYASSRLPGKPLLRSTGKYLVQHVYEQAIRAKNAQCVVATDDSRIVAAVESFGGRAIMTRRDHPSGTDRVAEVARTIDAEYYVNLQGDEPMFDPRGIDSMIDLLESDAEACLATLAAPIADAESFRDANCVKVVCDSTGRAMFFSRSPIPCVRDGEPDFSARPPRFLQHVGVYAYRKSALLELAAFPPSPLEHAEKLEQLRALAHGMPIQVGITAQSSRGVDTLDDYRRFVNNYFNLKSQARRAA
jgi:3-deoxy-manno-octulosonate cytidylyltransferase (CMP-KDO synthetase)